MRDFLREQISHAIRCGEHALADLCAPRKAAGETDLHVAIFIGCEPGGGLHVAFAQHRSGAHRGVHFVASAIEEARIDEHDAVSHRRDAGRKIRGGPPLFVHDAHFERVARHAEQIFDGPEQLIGERDLPRSVHLRFDDVHRPCATVDVASVASQVVQRDQARDDRIEYAFGQFRARGIAHGRRRHEMPHVAHQQHAATGQRKARAVRREVLAIARERARQGLAAFVEARLQRATHQAEPVAIGGDFVVRIDGRDRILEIHDARQCRLEHHVRDLRGVRATHRMRRIDDDFDVQTVMTQQPVLPRTADELRRLCKAQLATAPIGPLARGERHAAIEKFFGPGDHLRTARRIVPAPRRLTRQRIGAVERIVKTAPACVGRVQHEARIEHRHDELRPRERCEFRIDVRRLDREWRGLIDEVSDPSQKRVIRGRIERGARVRRVPGVDIGLQTLTLGEQGEVHRCKAGKDFRKPAPEVRDVDADLRQRFVLEKVRQRGGDAQSCALDGKILFAHGTPPGTAPDEIMDCRRSAR